MKTILITLLVASTLTPSLLAAENKKKSEQPEKRTPYTKLIKLTDFETNGNWMEEDGGVLHLKPREGEKGWKRYGLLRLDDVPGPRPKNRYWP